MKRIFVPIALLACAIAGTVFAQFPSMAPAPAFGGAGGFSTFGQPPPTFIPSPTFGVPAMPSLAPPGLPRLGSYAAPAPSTTYRSMDTGYKTVGPTTTTVTPRPFGGGVDLHTPGQPTTTITPRPFGGGFQSHTPGEPTTTITPRPFGGGYNVTAPGAPTTTMTPRAFGGGYDVHTPGQATTTITPRPFGGGYDVRTPGQPSTTITPRPFGGGATIYAPMQVVPAK